MSEERESNSEHRPPERQPEQPAQPQVEGERVNLSLEEKGMMMAPAVPIPTNEIDVGNMPSAGANPPEGNAGGDQGGSDGGGASSE